MIRSSVLGVPMDELRRSFAAEGYLRFERVVDEARLEQLGAGVFREFECVKRSGRLFSGGGTMSGHLNCFPGARSRFVWETLEDCGIFDLARVLSPAPLRQPNVGCNFNLPGSAEQNEHVDGYAAEPFLVVNVAVVRTDLENGAMEIIPRTHVRRHKYWEIMLPGRERIRPSMNPGDVLVRISSLWHRGMPNRTAVPRPMLAFTWEDGGNDLSDPYAVHDGRITFLPNRYRTDWKGRLRERAFVVAPGLGKALRIVQSVFEAP